MQVERHDAVLLPLSQNTRNIAVQASQCDAAITATRARGLRCGSVSLGYRAQLAEGGRLDDDAAILAEAL